MHVTPRFRLDAFGTLRLHDSAGVATLGQGPQRLRLALLAVLAAAGDRGRSRDQLLALLWPEATQARARHSLDQLLYAIRTSVHEAVFDGVNPLRLNPDVIATDVGAFQAALAAGDLQTAVSHYHGPFLDGFFLSDSEEFERWVEGERARFREQYRQALERLATAASESGEHRVAAGWWRALAGLDPLDSRSAEGLIRALALAGDRVNALRHAESYEALVQRELETDAGPDFAALMTELRSGAIPAAPRNPPIMITQGANPGAPDTERVPAAGLQVERVAGDEAPVPQSTESASPATPRSRRPVLLALVASLLVLGAFGGSWFQRRSAPPGERPATAPAIAVLPLAVRSGDPSDVALADGLTEELIAALGRAELRPVASTSVFALRDQQLDVRRIADSLHVPLVLEGALQRSGTRVRIQFRLVDGHSGSTRWAATYEHELNEWFTVQQQVAGAVAREMGLRLGAHAVAELRRQPTTNLAAYEFYLRGQDLTLFRSDSGVQARLHYFRQAVALDSNFAGAQAGLAYSFVTLYVSGWGTRLGSSHELHAQAMAAARRAVELDSSLAEAHAALGVVHLIGMRDLRAAERHLQRAAELPTPSRASEHLVQVYIGLGRPEAALAAARRGIENDPLSPTASAEVAHALLANRRCDEALAQLEQTDALRPPLARAGLYRATCHAMHERWDEAIAALTPRPGARGRALLGHILARAGRTAEAERVLAEMVERWNREEVRAYELAVVHAGFGATDEAFHWLNRAVDERSISTEIMEPLFADLHRDPRFDLLRARLGLS